MTYIKPLLPQHAPVSLPARSTDPCTAELEASVLELLGVIAEIKAERDTARGKAKAAELVNAVLRLDLARSDRDNKRLTEVVADRDRELLVTTAAAEEITRALCGAERENTELRAAKERRRRWRH